jgi:cysteine desulfurase
MRQVYLDNHSGTRIDDRVYGEMLPFLKESYGNAQSMHSLGSKSKDALDNARRLTAELINARDEEIYFTSCGSESNNLAVKGAVQANAGKGRHIVISNVEHFSVLNAAKRLEQAGFEVTAVPADKYGLIAPDDIGNAIRKDTVLVSVQQANPEIGTIQPIEEISKITRREKVLFHTDAVCSAGTIPVDVVGLGVDMLSLAGSQFYGPRGAAALYIKKGVRITPQIDGGIQENGRRAGTENIPAIIGLGKSCAIAKAEMADNLAKMLGLRNRLIQELPGKIEYAYLNGHQDKRMPNNVNFSIEFIEGESMLLFLGGQGIYVSSGSSCSSKALKMSHVLAALKLDPAVAQGSVLMTLSKYNSAEDIDYILNEFPPIVQKLRDMSPLYAYFKKTGDRKAAGPGTDFDHDHDHDSCEA